MNKTGATTTYRNTQTRRKREKHSSTNKYETKNRERNTDINYGTHLSIKVVRLEKETERKP